MVRPISFILCMISFVLVESSVRQDKETRLYIPAQIRKNDRCDSKAQQIWILVHGTFARYARWYKKGGKFFEALLQVLPSSAYITSFEWSGKFRHKARIDAALQLVEFIEKVAKPSDIINVVGHSHGATVAVLAARFLKEKQSPYHITQLFTLAPPVLKNSIFLIWKRSTIYTIYFQ